MADVPRLEQVHRAAADPFLREAFFLETCVVVRTKREPGVRSKGEK
jgi:hypothetical protein